ncbi:hypothetical protein K7432_002278 [Basidiobolus ranarum]|uniref:Exosome complex protein n=1 Tax=Basidiobolus ranarum TaxID=34480 RepID=A0ABR2X1S7_9FUNG
MTNTITLGDAMNQLEASLSKIQAHLEPLLSSPLNETIGKLPVMDRCKLEVMVAYAINTLFWIYLKTQGVPPSDHPVMKELERIRGYIQKIKETEGTHKPTMSVDKEAAARFIKNALADSETTEVAKKVVEEEEDNMEVDEEKVEAPVEVTEGETYKKRKPEATKKDTNTPAKKKNAKAKGKKGKN